jgi:hypothetical protein
VVAVLVLEAEAVMLPLLVGEEVLEAVPEAEVLKVEAEAVAEAEPEAEVVLETVPVLEEAVDAVPVAEVLEAESVVVEESEDSTLNCWDWARMPLFWGSLETKLTW